MTNTLFNKTDKGEITNEYSFFVSICQIEDFSSLLCLYTCVCETQQVLKQIVSCCPKTLKAISADEGRVTKQQL